MAKRVIILIGCLLLLSLLGCKQPLTPTPIPTPTLPNDEDYLANPTRLQGIVSSSNTSVKLYFNNPVSDVAQDVSLYKIFRPQLCEGNDWHAQLDVTKVELNPAAKIVTLTTAPQAGLTYQLSFSGLHDLQGNPVEMNAGQGFPVIFTGTAASQATQTDGDSVSDTDEQVGWAVRTVSTEGISLCRDVNSDPGNEDTDGDQVADDIEMGYAADPRSPDTDGDDLSDHAEIYEYFSNPLRSDTDQDGISDGIEASLYNTSPVLPDTDGDSISDSQEIASGGTDARLADLPELSLDLHGNPSIILNMSVKENVKTTKVETTLEQDRQEQVDTDNSSTKMSIENTVSLHTEVEVGTSQWPPSASAKLTTDTQFKHGYFHETSSSWTDQSVVDSQNKFENALEKFTVTSYNDGMLWVPMKVSNNSDLSFKVKDLRVIAYRMLPNGSFSAVGTLTPGEKSSDANGKDIWVRQPLCADPADPATCGHVLGPGADIVLLMGADSLPAQEMKELVRDPSALMFDIGSYSLFQLDEWGVKETVNYAKLGESVIQRTGILVIDYGNGTVERHMVATNALRNPDGSGKGITLEEALKDIIGLSDYELCPDGQTLCRLKNIATFRCDDRPLPTQIPADFCPPETMGQTNPISPTLSLTATQTISPTIPLGFWMVAGTGTQFEKTASLDFNAIQLMNGERVNLVYLLDSDGEGIFDREEYLLGTNKNNPDSDGDGLSDYQETKESWVVSVQGKEAYQVFSDPRFIDFDKDFLSDSTERYMQTDPNLFDTDRDGLSDNIDPYPTSLPCVDPGYLTLAAWWDGSGVTSLVNGKIVATSKALPTTKGEDWRALVKGISDPKEKVFAFNLDKQTQYLAVSDTSITHPSIHSDHELTLSAWLNWNGNITETAPDTIISKGPVGSATYSLSILADGKLQFTIFRRVHEKKWQCSGGSCWDDNAAKDDEYNQQELLTSYGPIHKGQWIHVAASFGAETMRIFVNGEKIAEKSTTSDWVSGSTWGGREHRTTTTYLIPNNDPLMIGLEKVDSPASPYRGMLDDIQIYTRMLGPQEVAQLYNLGVCRP